MKHVFSIPDYGKLDKELSKKSPITEKIKEMAEIVAMQKEEFFKRLLKTHGYFGSWNIDDIHTWLDFNNYKIIIEKSGGKETIYLTRIIDQVMIELKNYTK